MRKNMCGAALVALALVAAACGGGDDAGAAPGDLVATTPPAPVDQEAGQDAPVAGTDADAATPAATPERPAPNPDRAIAPDFSLALGDGSTFVLSDETRPVFMVFWAEW